MAFRLKFSAQALGEMGEARKWCDAQSPALGGEFLTAIERQLKRLEQAPLLFGNSPPRVTRRRFLMLTGRTDNAPDLLRLLQTIGLSSSRAAGDVPPSGQRTE